MRSAVESGEGVPRLNMLIEAHFGWVEMSSKVLPSLHQFASLHAAASCVADAWRVFARAVARAAASEEALEALAQSGGVDAAALLRFLDQTAPAVGADDAGRRRGKPPRRAPRTILGGPERVHARA